MSHSVVETARKKTKHMACLHVFVQVSLILSYFWVEICGSMSNSSQGRITRHAMRKKEVTTFLSFCCVWLKYKKAQQAFLSL